MIFIYNTFATFFYDKRLLMQSYKIANKKLPHTKMQGSFFIFLTKFISQKSLLRCRSESFLREKYKLLFWVISPF